MVPCPPGGAAGAGICTKDQRAGSISGVWRGVGRYALQRSGQFWRVLAVPAAVYVLGTLLRAAINRPRPYEALNFTPLFPKDTKGQSMPSRHCFSAAAIVAAAFTVWVPLGVAACLLAAVVAVTRVLTGVHYPSDVLAGLAFGAGAAVIGFLL